MGIMKQYSKDVMMSNGYNHGLAGIRPVSGIPIYVRGYTEGNQERWRQWAEKQPKAPVDVVTFLEKRRRTNLNKQVVTDALQGYPPLDSDAFHGLLDALYPPVTLSNPLPPLNIRWVVEDTINPRQEETSDTNPDSPTYILSSYERESRRRGRIA